MGRGRGGPEADSVPPPPAPPAGARPLGSPVGQGFAGHPGPCTPASRGGAQRAAGHNCTLKTVRGKVRKARLRYLELSTQGCDSLRTRESEVALPASYLQ